MIKVKKQKMISRFFNKRPLVENCHIVNVSVFVRKMLIDIKPFFKEIYKRDIDLRNEEDVKKFIQLSKKITVNLKEEINGQIKESKKNTVQLTYTKSNLNKGFIFWFICNGCGQKTRFLYFPPNSEDLLCRNCHRLTYEKNNKKKDKQVKNLLSNHALRIKYLLSNKLSEMLVGLEAETLLEKARKKINERVDKRLKRINNLISTQV
jgi:hypothetical protein